MSSLPFLCCLFYRVALFGAEGTQSQNNDSLCVFAIQEISKTLPEGKAGKLALSLFCGP